MAKIVFESLPMDEAGSSEAITPENGHVELVRAPKDYLISPVFAAHPQSGPREVTVGERVYQIGGFHPLDDTLRPPALDVRHARAIFTLLSFREEGQTTQLIRFSFNEFCRRYASSNGGRYARAIKKILKDLTDSYIRITDKETCIGHQYRLIERIDIETRPPRRRDSKLAKSPQREMFFNGCTLSPEFCGLLGNIAELQYLKWRVFNSISSPLAQAIYLYIPSRADYCSERRPFEINLKNLLQQVSAVVPRTMSKRKEMFTKNARPILKQLDGLETLNGRFPVRPAQTKDGTDYKLQSWVEKEHREQRSRPLSNSKLIAAWVEAGGSLSELERRLANAKPLDENELYLLDKAAVRFEGNDRFFVMAKAMLSRQQFLELLHEAKNDEMEGHAAKKNPTARLIWRIISAIKSQNFAPLSRPAGLDN